eukprot:TRINITY_DN34001_c0_g1_i1.p1 TRINITY_DN34001_c0_g1~~TRINITY_DN34001_c0_g1_i1.p1  ORF type:complete len:286 (+),score=11.75 TRINITY_DN34001_c0_g1_i1:538-1395(+)
MMEKNVTVGWFANSYFGMFFSTLVTAAAPGLWTLDESQFPESIMHLLNTYNYETLLTRGDLPEEHQVYSPGLQSGTRGDRIIDREWLSASPNMFVRTPGESMLYFLYGGPGGLNGQKLMANVTRQKEIIRSIINDYITRNNKGTSERDNLVGEILEEFRKGREWHATNILLDPVLLMLAINPNKDVSKYVCLTGIFGAVHKDDTRSRDNVWHNRKLEAIIRRYNKRRYFAGKTEDESMPQLRVSPITPRHSSHAVAIPFYNTGQRDAWNRVRQSLERLMPDLSRP